MPSNTNKSNRRHVDEMNETSFQEQSEEEQDLFDSLRCIPSSMDPRPSRQNQNPASNKRIRSDSLEMTYIPDDQVIVRGPEHFAREDPNLALHFKPSKGDLQRAIDQYSIANCIFVVELFFRFSGGQICDERHERELLEWSSGSSQATIFKKPESHSRNAFAFKDSDTFVHSDGIVRGKVHSNLQRITQLLRPDALALDEGSPRSTPKRDTNCSKKEIDATRKIPYKVICASGRWSEPSQCSGSTAVESDVPEVLTTKEECFTFSRFSNPLCLRTCKTESSCQTDQKEFVDFGVQCEIVNLSAVSEGKFSPITDKSLACADIRTTKEEPNLLGAIFADSRPDSQMQHSKILQSNQGTSSSSGRVDPLEVCKNKATKSIISGSLMSVQPLRSLQSPCRFTDDNSSGMDITETEIRSKYKSSRASKIDFLLNSADGSADDVESPQSMPISAIKCEGDKCSENQECGVKLLNFSEEMFDIGINHIASQLASRIYRRIESSTSCSSHEEKGDSKHADHFV